MLDAGFTDDAGDVADDEGAWRLGPRDAPVVPEVDAVPGGGATRSTWPTSIASGFVIWFQRAIFATDWRFDRAILESVSPRSTR
ncbi:hypothetical protein DM46_1933 [Burkholderia mallei]|nr:hypothetical protein DM46_1933 [Burkholderia mallei]